MKIEKVADKSSGPVIKPCPKFVKHIPTKLVVLKLSENSKCGIVIDPGTHSKSVGLFEDDYTFHNSLYWEDMPAGYSFKFTQE